MLSYIPSPFLFFTVRPCISFINPLCYHMFLIFIFTLSTKMSSAGGIMLEKCWYYYTDSEIFDEEGKEDKGGGIEKLSSLVCSLAHRRSYMK